MFHYCRPKFRSEKKTAASRHLDASSLNFELLPVEDVHEAWRVVIGGTEPTGPPGQSFSVGSEVSGGNHLGVQEQKRPTDIE